eukprot:Polyplicarium_translucidae@DN3257_c0_g1_i6.p1
MALRRMHGTTQMPNVEGPLHTSRLSAPRFVLFLLRYTSLEAAVSIIVFSANLGVASYALVLQRGCLGPNGAWILGALALGCCRIASQLILLKGVWEVFAVTGGGTLVSNVVRLLKSKRLMLTRALALLTIVWYFVGFRQSFGINESGTSPQCDSSAVLRRYTRIVSLVFISSVGIQVMNFLLSLSSIVYGIFMPAERFGQVFDEGSSLPLPRGTVTQFRTSSWGDVRRESEELPARTSINSGDPPRTAKLSPVSTSDGASDQAHCAICLCEFHDPHVVRCLPCGHIFHKSCIDAWLRRRGSCPFRCVMPAAILRRAALMYGLSGLVRGTSCSPFRAPRPRRRTRATANGPHGAPPRPQAREGRH